MIQFEKEDTFYYELKTRVNNYFKENVLKKSANKVMYLKLLTLYFFTLTSYALIFLKKDNFTVTLLFAFCYGVCTFLIAFNVVHDAGHNSLFQTTKSNKLSLLTLDFFGVSSFIWVTTHHLHHHSPNVINHDTLVDEFKLGKLVPKGNWKWIFQFQAFYIPVLSLFYSMSLVLISDFVKFKSVVRKTKKKKNQILLEFSKLLISKTIALVLTVILPYYYFGFSLLELCVFFFFIHLGPGIIVGLFVAPAHFNTHLSFPTSTKSGTLTSSWSEHQLLTTEDFATKNPVFNFMLGGFNHHVAHHLFPEICHIHYPKITPIIQQTAKEFNIHYSSSSFIKLYISHLKHLHLMGKKKQTN